MGMVAPILPFLKNQTLITSLLNLLMHASLKSDNKFTIFLPVRNGRNYISSCIESILSQEYENFDLVILENKSTDDTLSIVRSYDDPRIKVIEASSTLGMYENWRRVYELIQSGKVSSEFSTIIGHDDILYSSFLKGIVELITTYPDASLYQTHFDLIDAAGNLKRPCKPIPAREYAKDFLLARCWGNRDSFGTGYVFRTTDYEKIGGIPDLPSLLWSDDLMIVRLTTLSYKVCGGGARFAYRLHSDSVSGSLSKTRFTAMVNALNKYQKEIEKHHQDLLVDDYDKVAFGFFLARQMEEVNLPLRSMLFDTETISIIKRLNELAHFYLKGNTVNKISELSSRWLFGQLRTSLRRWKRALKLLGADY